MKKVTIKSFDTGDHMESVYYLERGLLAWGILGDVPSGNGDWAERGPDALIRETAKEYGGPRVGQCHRWHLGFAEVVSVEGVAPEEEQRVYMALGRNAARGVAAAADDAQRKRWAAAKKAEMAG